MRIPDKVRVGAQVYDVVYDAAVGNRGFDGECSPSRLEILLMPTGKTRARQHQIFLHEVVEAMSAEYSLGLDEHHIALLETALYGFITDNPEVFLDDGATETADPPGPDN